MTSKKLNILSESRRSNVGFFALRTANQPKMPLSPFAKQGITRYF